MNWEDWGLFQDGTFDDWPPIEGALSPSEYLQLISVYEAAGFIEQSDLLDAIPSFDEKSFFVDLAGAGILDIIDNDISMVGLDTNIDTIGIAVPMLADYPIAAAEDYSFPGYGSFVYVHGSPIEDMGLWDPQDTLNSCAVASTNMMFRSYGLDIGEETLASVFEAAGIYDPVVGTDPFLIDDVINDLSRSGNLGIVASEHNGFTLEDLQSMLDNGIRPLVAVDASELYTEMGIPPDVGHAVQVTGIISNSSGDFIVINDPGFFEGAGQMISADQFMAAADDFGHTAISIDLT